MIGKTPCASCQHPLAIHVGVGGTCRINACGCTEYRAADKPQTGARSVTLDIPDGYVLNVQLVPVDAADG